MYQSTSNYIEDLMTDQQYLQLAKTPKCCQMCKKVSAPKRKNRRTHSDVTLRKCCNNNNNNHNTNSITPTINSPAFPVASTISFDMLAHTCPALRDSADAEIQSEAINSSCNRSHRQPTTTMYRRLCTLILFCALFSVAEGCGPGRGIGGPRKYRKLTPLVFKQHVPNMSERTLGASGLNEGVIKRSSPKFKNLVPNYNKDIIFKDDEGTGADRLMSRRCKEKLNILAVSVMNQWPGVRLRVTESWDEDNAHHTDSLHYEGRAVDITTSDRDRTKYGMLARLAVEAGFDWVYYESRAHIHCSVKSDSKHIPHVSGCFAADSSVLLSNGQRKYIRDVKIGDRVLAMSSTGQPVYSEVILFMDRNLDQTENFVQINTEDSDATLTLTPAHLVLIWHPNAIERQTEYMFAARVQVDDYVFVYDHYGRLSPRRVLRLEVVRKSGVIAPLTREGTIVVNSVTASCYAVVNSQKIAHWGLAPMRLIATIRSWLPGSCSSSGDESNEVDSTVAKVVHVERNAILASNATTTNTTTTVTTATPHIEGIHWYAQFLYAIKDAVLPQQWIYQ
ncbi:protein hedgehog [Eurosta solidaginis]|uniref:protein hedgehog n=1 Tax=Eurosta solidaginis TaxID=178769 RepID=UPI0035308D03